MFYLIGWLSDNGFNWLLMVQTHTIIFFFKQGFMPQFNGFERINGIFRVIHGILIVTFCSSVYFLR